MFSKAKILLQLFVLCTITAEIDANARCLQCTSETDENCAEGTVSPSECPLDQDSCYSRLVASGHVVRGCIQNTQDCLPDASCTSCSEDGCNNVFWLKCHKCGSGDAGCGNEQVGSPEFCSKNSDLNLCYSRLENGLVTRGCGVDDSICLNEDEGQNCQVCYSDGCNGLAQAALKPSKCQMCIDSSGDCLEGNSNRTIDCSALADSCLSMLTGITSSDVLIRACAQALGSRIRSCDVNPLCMVCQGDNCNDKRRLRCHQCRATALDSSCREEQTFGSWYCANYREGDRCYTRVVNGFFERGCLSDLEPNVSVCDESGVENCYLCDDIGCNSQRSSSAVAKGSSSISLLVIVIAFFRYKF